MTPSKGYGAFYAGEEPLPEGTFLGCYEGELVASREALDALHASRRKDLSSRGLEEDAARVGDYVLSLDGGVHFLDGFDLRYRGSGSDNEAFTPAHLNHADKTENGCNVLRKLVYLPDDLALDSSGGGDNSTPLWGDEETYPRSLPRVAFFAAREISRDEELAFDYGTNFWNSESEPANKRTN